MGLTSSGAICDVCGHYILPDLANDEERVNWFKATGIDRDLCCHNKCKGDVLNAKGKWENLPEGPLRKAYAEAAQKVGDST